MSEAQLKRREAEDLLELAQTYLTMAKSLLAPGSVRGAIDLAYNAAELCVRAFLLLRLKELSVENKKGPPAVRRWPLSGGGSDSTQPPHSPFCRVSGLYSRCRAEVKQEHGGMEQKAGSAKFAFETEGEQGLPRPTAVHGLRACSPDFPRRCRTCAARAPLSLSGRTSPMACLLLARCTRQRPQCVLFGRSKVRGPESSPGGHLPGSLPPTWARARGSHSHSWRPYRPGRATRRHTHRSRRHPSAHHPRCSRAACRCRPRH
jgi:hypothetical protein